MSSPEPSPPPAKTVRNLIILIVVVIVVAVVAFLIRDYVRQFVAPLVLYALWLTQIIFSSLPQALLWAVFLIVAISLAWRSLVESRQRVVRRVRPPDVYYGRVEELVRMAEQAHRGEYFARRLERQVSDLTLEMLGHGEKLTPTQTQAVVEQVRGRVPGLVYEFLQRTTAERLSGVDMMSQYNNRFSAIADTLLRRARHDKGYDPDVDLVMAYLEQELEVKSE